MKKITILFLALFCLGFGKGKAQYTDLLNFNITNGEYPLGSLINYGDTLYGMTKVGGAIHLGCLFSIQTDGSGYKDLHDFGAILNDGRYPYGSLVRSGDTLYGMTFQGGSVDSGVIFSIRTDGSNYTDLHDCKYYSGVYPYGTMILRNSTLYGMAELGGANGSGVVFSMNTNGSGYKDIYDFNLFVTGGAPYSSLILSADTLYGMTQDGGSVLNDGCVFSVQTNGSNYKELIAFNGTNGMYPKGNLNLYGDTLYGMTYKGGANDSGTIFCIQTNGIGYKDLLDLNGATGAWPWGSLIRYDSVFYGMSSLGVHTRGTLFSIQANGSGYKIVLPFTALIGANPQGDPLFIGNTIYGMTQGGGTGSGNIFKFKDTTITTSIKQVTMGRSQLSAYPNPSTGIFTMHFAGAQNFEPENIGVYNVLGERVETQSITSLQKTINLTNQPNGVYFYRVVSENGSLIGEGKIVKD